MVLIFGFGSGQPRDLGEVAPTTCPNCHNEVYLHHVVDNDWCMAEYGHQAVVWPTAINPVIALELLAAGTWAGAGVLGPEAFDAVPFLDLLTAYGSPWGIEERPPRPA